MVVFDKKYRIHVYETGFDGKVYLHSMLNYMQDIASEHAGILGFGREDLMASNRFWILSRLLAEFYRLPAWGETINLRTWPRGTEGLLALRDIEVTDEAGKIIAAASTSWVIVDADTRRPCRPDAEPSLRNLDFPESSALNRNASKVAPPSGDTEESLPFQVKPSDLDLNLHVNNVKYIQWIMDTMSVAFLSSGRIVSLEANYLAEGIEGDEIRIRKEVQREENNSLRCSVIKSSDGRELCRIMIGMESAGN